MSAETALQAGDIVWIKCLWGWRPAQVQDMEKLKDNIKNEAKKFPKPPVAVIKLLNEDSFKFPRSPRHIYPYNGPRKDKFIKLGMDLYLEGCAGFRTFPEEVKLAERGENPDYILEEQIKTNLCAPGATDVSGIPSPRNIQSENEPDIIIFCGQNLKPPKELIEKFSTIVTLNIVKKGEEAVTPGLLFNIPISRTPPADFVPARPDDSIISLLKHKNQPSRSHTNVLEEKPPASAKSGMTESNSNCCTEDNIILISDDEEAYI